MVLYNDKNTAFRYDQPIKVKDIITQKTTNEELITANLTYEIEKPGNRGGDIEEFDDISDGELLELFTEFFSLFMLNKKKRKRLELNNFDDGASLPHPNNLLKK